MIHHYFYYSSNTLPEMDATNYTYRSPVGVAGIISPWNLPLYLLTFKIAPAIAAGCTVVCKPSEMTSLTAYMLAEVMNDAGNIVHMWEVHLFLLGKVLWSIVKHNNNICCG